MMKDQVKKFGTGTAKVTWQSLIIAVILALLNGIPSPKPEPIPPAPPVPVDAKAPLAKLTCPAVGTVGDPIVISSTGSLGKRIKLRESYDKADGWLFEAYDAKGMPTNAFMARKPMTLVTTLLAVRGDNSDEAEVRTVFGGEPQPPTPPDPPTPPIPPEPPIEPVALSVTVIEETSQSTQEVAQIRSSSLIRDYANSGGHIVFFLDKDLKDKDGKTPETFRPWIELAKGKELPRVFIVGMESKKLIFETSLPRTPTAFITLLEKYGGKTNIPGLPDSSPCPNGLCPVEVNR